MMNYARELMDSDNEILSKIGYEIWSNDGLLSQHGANEICKMLLDLEEQPTPDESFSVGYNVGYEEGYAKGFEAGKQAQVTKTTNDLSQIMADAVRKK